MVSDGTKWHVLDTQPKDVVYAHTFPGPTADVQINNAVAAVTDGGSVDARGYGATSRTIAANVAVGSSVGLKTVTLLLDRTTKFTCTITDGTACWTVHGGSALIGLGGVVTNPNAGFQLAPNANVSNLLLYTNNIPSNLVGGYIEGITLIGNSTATVTDAVFGVRNVLQISHIKNVTIGGGTRNTVMLKIYATGNNLAAANINLDNVQIDGAGAVGARPIWIGCAGPGSLTTIRCGGTGSVTNISFIGGLAVHPGPGGLPIVDIEGGDGSGGQNTVGNINFIGFQVESSNPGDIGILDNGASSLTIHSLLASCGGVCGTDVVKISQPGPGAPVDGITISNLTNQGGWANTISNTVIPRTIPGLVNGFSYRYVKNFSALDANVWADGDGYQATIDEDGVRARRFAVSLGTALVAADFGTLDSKWGNTSALSAIAGTDQAFTFTINVPVGATGMGPNPTITLTFHDGTWGTNPPVFQVQRNDLAIPYGSPPHTWSETTTNLTITFNGTPVAGNAYVFRCTALGK